MKPRQSETLFDAAADRSDTGTNETGAANSGTKETGTANTGTTDTGTTSPGPAIAGSSVSSASAAGASDGATIVVYTDGACSGNPGPGGWGWAVSPDGEPHANGGEANTTNQRMELTAVLEALKTLGGDGRSAIEVVSDSTYVVNCFRDGWWKNWKRNGWKNAKKQPVANSDLWKELVAIVERGGVTFRWVKGHSGHPMNEMVDRLAVAAVPVSG